MFRNTEGTRILHVSLLEKEDQRPLVATMTYVGSPSPGIVTLSKEIIIGIVPSRLRIIAKGRGLCLWLEWIGMVGICLNPIRHLPDSILDVLGSFLVGLLPSCSEVSIFLPFRWSV